MQKKKTDIEMKKITTMNLEMKTNIYTRKIDMSSDYIKTEWNKMKIVRIIETEKLKLQNRM